VDAMNILRFQLKGRDFDTPEIIMVAQMIADERRDLEAAKGGE
jgi:hypothetical protein